MMIAVERYVRFGLPAARQVPIISTAALERKAVTQQEFSATKNLTAAFAVKQSFNWLQTRCY
jgi:hypothetical protein